MITAAPPPPAAPASSSSRVRPPAASAAAEPPTAPPLPNSQSLRDRARWTAPLGQWIKGNQAEGLAGSPREYSFLIGHEPLERQADRPTKRATTAPKTRAGASEKKERGALLWAPRFHWSGFEDGL